MPMPTSAPELKKLDYFVGSWSMDGDLKAPLGPGGKVTSIDSNVGENESATGTIEGETWTWLADENMGGHKMKGRFTMKILSPSAYTYKF